MSMADELIEKMEEWAEEYFETGDIEEFLERVAGCLVPPKTLRGKEKVEKYILEELELLGEEFERAVRKYVKEMGLEEYWRPSVGRIARRLLLDDYAGLRVREIAEDLGVSPSTVYYARWLIRKAGFRLPPL